jgi:hypothetical protein
MACSREDAIKTRIQCALARMGASYPGSQVEVDLWRPMVVSINPLASADEQVEQWVKLADAEVAFLIERPERFFQSNVGIVNQKKIYLALYTDHGLRPDDHAVFNGQSSLIYEVTTQMGITWVTLDPVKTRFRQLPRGSTMFRQFGIKAKIQ